MIRDLRHATRSLVQRPGFALAGILTLGLGLGANTVILDLINLVSWQRPDVAKPEELVRIHTRSRAEWIGPYGNSSYGDFLDYRATATSFSGLVAVQTAGPRLRIDKLQQQVQAGLVSVDYFEVLGVGAALGRMLEATDATGDGTPALVLSHRLWQLLGADPSLVGRAVWLDDQAFIVVGVAAKDFAGSYLGNRLDLWLPLERHESSATSAADRSRLRTGIIGRLKPGKSAPRSLEELRLIAGRLDDEHPLKSRSREVTIAPVTLTHPLDRRNFLPTLRILLAGVGLLLLLTCANVGNLLLARNTARGREMGVRAALGANRWRLARQLLAESLVLAVAGGATGLLLAHWGRRLVSLTLGHELDDFVQALRFDARVLGLTLAICLVSALLSGLAPIRAVAKADLVTILHGGSLGGKASGRRWAASDALVVFQIALAAVLLVASGLLVRSMSNLWRADPGFDTRQLLSVPFAVDSGQRSRQEGTYLQQAFVDRAANLPGVRAAGLAMVVPPILLDITTDFHLVADPEPKHTARRNVVDGGFFEALDIPLLVGRLFSQADDSSQQGAVLVNRELATSLWPGKDPIGQRLTVAQRRPWEPAEYEVVGVVGNSVQDSFERSAQPILYFAAGQRYRPRMELVMRVDGDPLQMIGAVRQALRELDPSLTLEAARTANDIRWSYMTLERTRTLVLTTFAVLGLVLALGGVGSVLSAAVSRRRREIGIRMALGAHAADVQRLVIGRGLQLTIIGLGLGSLAALWVGRLLHGFLFGVGAFDATTLVIVAILLIVAALLAAWWPARRAARADPLIAMRQE